MESTLSTKSVTKNSIPGLDILRGVAALMVAVFHIKKYIWKETCPDVLTSIFQQGYLGVYLFFIVSGMVIPHAMFSNGYRTKDFFRFMSRRMIRLHPPYIIFILILFGWNMILHYWKGWGSWWLFDTRTFILNITYLAPFFKTKWILKIFWTLAVEFQFYILTGLIYEYLMKNRWWRYALYLIILAIGFLIPVSYETVFHHYIFFLIGFQSLLKHLGKIYWTEYIVSICASLTFIVEVKIPAAAAVSTVTLILIFLLQKPLYIGHLLGKISYSLYLTHGMIGGAVAVFTLHWHEPWWSFITGLAASILFATVYYRWIEKPFMALSKARAYRK